MEHNRERHLFFEMRFDNSNKMLDSNPITVNKCFAEKGLSTHSSGKGEK
jgi:hypothetical protein